MEEDLNVIVTPAVEDAFFFLSALENGKITDSSVAAGERLTAFDPNESAAAVHSAFQMIDNIRKYGIPCAQWA